MEIIVNDFSIDNQFKNFEEFLDSLFENTLPLFNLLEKYQYILLNSYETYSLKFFNDFSVHDILSNKGFNGSPEIELLKSILLQISCEEPYWNANFKTNPNNSYDIDDIENFKDNQPNCLTEAIERNVPLLTFEHEKFKGCNIVIRCNNEYKNIQSFFNKKMLIEYLLDNKRLTLTDYLCSIHKEKDIVFLKDNKSQYFSDNHFSNGDISTIDIRSIAKDFNLSIEFSRESKSSRFTDTIKYGGYTYYEFRCSLSNNREFRIYYYLKNGKTYYLNSHIKKTQTIPDKIKQMTIKLIKDNIK